MTLARVGRKTTPSTLGGVVSFLTVARASAHRMLDAPLGQVSAWVDGQPLYSSSFGGADWHWQADFPAATATDNETTCRPTSWIAGGLNGAAVRNAQGNLATRNQTTWRVDSTAADNEGSGLLADPLKNDYEIPRRWGEGTIPLSVPIAITYAQSPANVTNYDVMIMTGGGFELLGVVTVVKSGTFTAVTALNSATQTPWDVTGVGLGATDVQKIIRIPSGARANNYAVIAKDLTGGRVRTGPFANVAFAAICITGVTPQVGDPFEVITVPTLKVGTIRVRSGTNVAYVAGSPPTNCGLVDSLFLDGGSTSTNGAMVSDGAGIYYRQCSYQFIAFRGGGHFQAGGAFLGFNRYQVTFGVFGAPFVQAMAFVNFGTMAVEQGAAMQMGGQCLHQAANVQVRGYLYGEQIAMFDQTFADFAMIVNEGATYLSQPLAGADLLWGDANAGVGVKVTSTGKVVYTNKPTINTPQGANRQSRIGGTLKDWAAVPFVEPANTAAIVLKA